MAVPSPSGKTEVVAIQHVMEESEKPFAPDGVEIRHLRQKIVIPGSPYTESLTAQISEVSLLHSYRNFARRRRQINSLNLIASKAFLACGIKSVSDVTRSARLEGDDACGVTRRVRLPVYSLSETTPHPKAGWVAALSGECYDLGFHEPRNSQPAPCGDPLANVGRRSPRQSSEDRQLRGSGAQGRGRTGTHPTK